MTRAAVTPRPAPRRPAPRRLARAVPLGLVVTGILLPFVPLVAWSVSRTWRYPALWPQQISDRGLRAITDPAASVPAGLATSATIATVVAAVAAGIGLAAGRALGLHTFPGRQAVQFLLVAPVIVPGMAVSLGIQVVFIRYGLADTVAGVVLAHLIPATPYVTLVMAAAYARYDVAIEQQARVLGAPSWRVFWHVTLPAMRPSLVVAALLAFVISWNEYVLTLLIGGGVVRTLPLLLFSAISSGDTTVAAALALVVSLPPVLLLAVSGRHLRPSPGPLTAAEV